MIERLFALFGTMVSRAILLALAITAGLAFTFRDSLHRISWSEPLWSVIGEKTEHSRSTKARNNSETPHPNSPSNTSLERPVRDMPHGMVAPPSTASPAGIGGDNSPSNPPLGNSQGPLKTLPELPTVTVPPRPEPAMPSLNMPDASTDGVSPTRPRERILRDLLGVMQELRGVGTEVTEKYGQTTR